MLLSICCPIQQQDLDHEPGPNDPPGPHFESYGSSFGNLGPLPNGHNSWNGNGQVRDSSPSILNREVDIIRPGRRPQKFRYQRLKLGR